MRAKVDLTQISQKKQSAKLVNLKRIATKLTIIINKDNQYELGSKYS